MTTPLRRRIIGSLLIVSGLCEFAAAQVPQAAELQELPSRRASSGQGPSGFDAGLLGGIKPGQVEAWKQRYPFVSIRERLKYEAPQSRDKPDVRTAAETARQANWGDIRGQSLAMLHTMKVEDFIAASGNGFSRMRPPSGGRYLDMPPAVNQEFATVDPLSSDEAAIVPTTLLREEIVAANSPFAESGWLPTRIEASHLNSYAIHDFASPASQGLVKSLDQVAGFESHRFRRPLQLPLDAAPPQGAAAPKERHWKLIRLELVSLLKHDTPRVYESEQLPTMEELSSADAKTRPLDKFESAALARLGEYHHPLSESTPNRIRMLGPIRATNSCLRCHEVPDGTLLGAFSYELRRDPPIAISKSSAVVQ